MHTLQKMKSKQATLICKVLKKTHHISRYIHKGYMRLSHVSLQETSQIWFSYSISRFFFLFIQRVTQTLILCFNILKLDVFLELTSECGLYLVHSNHFPENPAV